MWAVTFVPDRVGKNGAFSVVEVSQLTTEHSLAFAKRMRDQPSPLCERAELILYIGNQDTASEICTKLQDNLRG